MTGRPDFNERRERRIFGLRAAADRARAQGTARVTAADKLAGLIPFGQPVLIGHHSERRHRRDLDRIHNGLRRGFEEIDRAAKLERRASSAEENRAVLSDDPEALDKLRAKLDALEAVSALRARNSDGRLRALGIKREQAVQRIEAARPLLGRLPSFAENLRARIRQVRERIAVLEVRERAGEKPPEQIGSVQIRESENRVQIIFPEKPSDTVRDALKRAGFRWARTQGAWQRHVSTDAWYQARKIAKSIASVRDEPPATASKEDDGDAAEDGPHTIPCCQCGMPTTYSDVFENLCFRCIRDDNE